MDAVKQVNKFLSLARIEATQMLLKWNMHASFMGRTFKLYLPKNTLQCEFGRNPQSLTVYTMLGFASQTLCEKETIFKWDQSYRIKQKLLLAEYYYVPQLGKNGPIVNPVGLECMGE